MAGGFVLEAAGVRWRLVTLLGLPLILLMCGAVMEQVGAQEAKKVEIQLPSDVEIEELLRPDPYTYDRTGKRDPFRSLTESQTWEVSTKVGLERFDLTELRLKGIVVGELGSFAMIEAPDRLTYFVTVDDAIGLGNGKVVHVDETSITVEEPYTDDFGNFAVRRVTLALEETD